IFHLLASCGQTVVKLLHVCNRIHIARGLLCPKYPIQIATNTDVVGIADYRAEMIPMIDQHLQADIQLPWIRYRVDKTDIHRPTVQHAADDCTSIDEPFDLLIAQLTLIRDDFPDVVMTCPDWPVILIQSLVKALFCEVSYIQNHV